MNKVIILFILFLISVNVCFATEWYEIFEKQYLHLTTIEPHYKDNSVIFWVKALRKDASEKIPNEKGETVPYWYSMAKWHLDCINKKERIEVLAIYDLKQKPIFWDETIPEWNTIVPDTYADGFYRLFCLLPFNENPLLENK